MAGWYVLQNHQISTKLVYHNEELGHSTMTLWGGNKEECFGPMLSKNVQQLFLIQSANKV